MYFAIDYENVKNNGMRGCEYLSEEKKNRIQRAWEAIEQCIRDAVANSMSDMSMEEIDEEIRLYRQSKK